MSLTLIVSRSKEIFSEFFVTCAMKGQKGKLYGKV